MYKPDNRRWPISEMPLKSKVINPKTHDKITKFEDFPEDSKLVLLEIKEILGSLLDEFKISVFGSRVNGNWVETSDYDIIIYTKEKLSNELIRACRCLKFPVKVDIFFSINEITSKVIVP